MQELTGVERINRILRHEPVDRIGLSEHFWGDATKRWQEQGHMAEGECIEAHFGFDLHRVWPSNMVADVHFEPETVEETDETILVRDGNGALLRRHKLHASTPEHIDFAVKDRAGWQELRSKLMNEDDYGKRINFQTYRDVKARSAQAQRWFCWEGINVFECMHPVCGHEHMLVGMIDDPDWVRDMADCYAQVAIDLMEILFSREGTPDGVWFYEDMGFKERPFMSPALYRELIMPAHKRTFDYCHSKGLPVIVHSCGFIEPLVPHMIEAGMDCLQVIEIKAGMDLLKLKKLYGDRIALFGGMDARALVANDREWIDRELAKIPEAMAGSGYILHSDHSITDQVEYETYRYFVDRGLEIGTY